MSHFGGYLGGDPRLFHPDPEMSSPDEMALHAQYCRAWDRGERVEPPVQVNGVGPDGHRYPASVRSFGVGVTVEPEDELEEQEPDLPLEELDDAELYGLYLSNAGSDSDQAMRILAERHHAELSYEDEERNE